MSMLLCPSKAFQWATAGAARKNSGGFDSHTPSTGRLLLKWWNPSAQLVTAHGFMALAAKC